MNEWDDDAGQDAGSDAMPNTNHSASTKFWAQDLSAIFSDWRFFPSPKMTIAEKLNAITRGVLLATLVMYWYAFELWPYFLGTSLILILIVASACTDKMN